MRFLVIPRLTFPYPGGMEASYHLQCYCADTHAITNIEFTAIHHLNWLTANLYPGCIVELKNFKACLHPESNRMFKVSPEIPVDEWVLVVEWSEEFAEIWAAFRQCDTTLNHPTDNGYQTDVIFSDPASLGSSAYSQCLLADENVGSSELKLLNCLIRAKNHLDASSSNSSEDDAKCLSVPATPFAGTCSDSEISVSSDSVSSPLHKHDFLVSKSLKRRLIEGLMGAELSRLLQTYTNYFNQ